MKQVIEKIKQRVKEHPTVVERMPGILHTIHFPAITLIKDLDKLDLSWRICYLAIKNKQLTIVYPEDRMVELGKRFLKEELKKPGSYKKLIDGWRKIEKEFHQRCKLLDKLGLTRLSLNELKEEYLKFTEIFRQVWALPLTSTNISYCADNVWVPKILERYGKDGLNDFITLSTPLELSFIKEEEKELLKIAIKSNKELKENHRKIIDHANTYHFLKNTYRETTRLGASYFLNKLKDIKNPETTLKKWEEEEYELNKKHKILRGKFTVEETTAANLIALATNFQDLRKKNNLIGNYYLFNFLKEISKKVNYSFDELCCTNIEEMKKILEGDNSLNLKDRVNCCVEVILVNFDKIFGGDEAAKLYDLINNIDKAKPNTTELKGIIASIGKKTGLVRVILDASNAKTFNQGDILVASMTRPDYTHLMKKAGAIVTDEGGITCHAAIISRELGIPCIIGTKAATQVLKDGMLVEVDAGHGVVKIIK